MITTAPPQSQIISSTSFHSTVSKKSLDGSAWRGDDDTKMKKEHDHQSDMVPQPANGYSSNGDTVSHSLNEHITADNGEYNGNGDMNNVPHNNGGDQVEMDQQRSKCQEQQQEDGEESQENSNLSANGPLHKTLFENFHSELNSMREATIEALQISCQEQERLCLRGEEFEARIAFLRKKISLARDELLESESLTEEMGDLRLSLVKEGEEDVSVSGLVSLDGSELAEAENKPSATSTMQRMNSSQGALHSSMPHMSRSSLLGMLGASKNWLDNSGSNENDENARGSFRLSFMEGAGDGMPSRWRAREQERANSEKQKEEEETRFQEMAINDLKNGAEGSSNSRKMKEMSKEEKLQDLICMREGEISSLEKRTSCVEQETSSLREEIYVLQKDQLQEQDNFDKERTELLNEIDQVESDNGRLDYMLVEAGVSREETKTSIEILANELKEVREELALIQNERDMQEQRRRRKDKSRRWSWNRSPSGEDESEHNQDQQQRKKTQSARDQGQVSRYQVPSDVMQQYRNLVDGGSDDDTSYDNLSHDNLSNDNMEASGSGGSGPRRLARRQSYASVGTCMSALTLDSCDLVDILEQLELDT